MHAADEGAMPSMESAACRAVVPIRVLAAWLLTSVSLPSLGVGAQLHRLATLCASTNSGRSRTARGNIATGSRSRHRRCPSGSGRTPGPAPIARPVRRHGSPRAAGRDRAACCRDRASSRPRRAGVARRPGTARRPLRAPRYVAARPSDDGTPHSHSAPRLAGCRRRAGLALISRGVPRIFFAIDLRWIVNAPSASCRSDAKYSAALNRV